MKDGAAEMAWGLRVCRPQSEDPSLVPSILVGWLTTTCYFGSKGLNISDFYGLLHSHEHNYTHKQI